jgi:hypothetical protein
MTKPLIAQTLGTAIFCVLLSAGCASTHTTPTTSGLPRGYLAFENVKVGISEENVKRAIFSFAPDPKGKLGNKTQYLSRNSDAQGGQYLVQCRNNQVYEVQVYHLAKPVSKVIALNTLKTLLPPEAQSEPAPKEDAQKNAKSGSELYHFRGTYGGELVHGGKDGAGVTIINAWFVPPATH